VPLRKKRKKEERGSRVAGSVAKRRAFLFYQGEGCRRLLERSAVASSQRGGGRGEGALSRTDPPLTIVGSKKRKKIRVQGRAGREGKASTSTSEER